MNTYQFRAELKSDVEALEQTLRAQYIYLDSGSKELPDVQVLLITTRSLDEVIGFMKQIPDGHVMVDTVQPASEYHGERAYYMPEGEPITELRAIIELLKLL